MSASGYAIRISEWVAMISCDPVPTSACMCESKVSWLRGQRSPTSPATVASRRRLAWPRALAQRDLDPLLEGQVAITQSRVARACVRAAAGQCRTHVGIRVGLRGRVFARPLGQPNPRGYSSRVARACVRAAAGSAEPNVGIRVGLRGRVFAGPRGQPDRTWVFDSGWAAEIGRDRLMFVQ